MIVITVNEFPHTSYERRNKRTGKKHIRCFPDCSVGGHKDMTFCGQSVEFHVKLPSPLNTHEFLVAYGELVPKDSPLRFLKTETYTIESLNSLKRVKDTDLPLFPCDIIEGKILENSYSIIVNPSCEAWHYPWVASRHSSNTLHCLRLYIFVSIAHSSSSLVGFLSSHDSSQFTICCTKKLLTAKTSNNNNNNNNNSNKRQLNNHREEEEEENLVELQQKHPKYDTNFVETRASDGYSSLIPYPSTSLLPTQVRYPNPGVSSSLELLPKPVVARTTTSSSSISSSSRSNTTDHSFHVIMEAVLKRRDILTIGALDSLAAFAGENCKEKGGTYEYSNYLLSHLMTGKAPDFERILLSNAGFGRLPLKVPPQFSQLLSELGKFLINDEDFTSDISLFFRNLRRTTIEPSAVDSLFEEFAALVKKNIEKFAILRGYTLEKLDELIQIMLPSESMLDPAAKASARGTIRRRLLKQEFLKRLKTPSLPLQFIQDVPKLDNALNLDGNWIYIGSETLANSIIDKIKRHGLPGNYLHLARNVWTRMEVTVNRDFLFLKGTEGMILKNELLFKLDGVLYDFHDHLSKENTFVSFGCDRRTNRAWVDHAKNSIFVESGYYFTSGAYLEFTREFQLSHDRIELYIVSDVCLKNQISGTRETLGKIMNPYLKVWSSEDTDFILDNISDSSSILSDLI